MDKYITYNLFIKVRFFHLCPAQVVRKTNEWKFSDFKSGYSFIYIGLSHVILLQLVLNFQEF